jgi:signal transduction histidine kinase
VTSAAEGSEDGLQQRLARAGEIFDAVRSIDWSVTPVGAMDHWPQSLRTALSLCLSFPDPACLVWGAARTQLFNDRYRMFFPVESSPRPGQDFAERWRAEWPVIGPAFERAWSGEPVRIEIPLPMPAADARAETAALCFLPVLAEEGATGGVLVSVVHTRQNAELERAEKDLDMLDYAISHDLHSPLRTMQEMARILADEHAKPAAGDAGVFLQHIIQATAKLNERIEGLVRYRRISRQQLAPRRLAVGEMIEGLLAEQRADVAGQRVSIVVGKLPDAFGDYDLIRQAFAAVLTNAFKFLRDAQAPQITIGARPEAGRNVYFIADNGVGFDMKYAGRLFGLFQRLHNDAQFKGAGIGLALARRVIERHGGTMRAAARKGEGATFELTLPALGDAPPSA